MKTAIKTELDRLKLENGKLMPSTVVNAARDKSSPLHDYFTWDAREALKKHLLYEATQLIREYHVVIMVGDKAVKSRHFVSLSSDRVSGGGYRVIETVLNDDGMRQQLLVDALSELSSFSAKYRRLSELVEVFTAIDKLAQTEHIAA